MFKKVNWSKVGDKIEQGAKKALEDINEPVNNIARELKPAYENLKEPVNNALKQITQATGEFYEYQKVVVTDVLRVEKQKIAQKNEKTAPQEAEEAAQDENAELEAQLKLLEEGGSDQFLDSDSEESVIDLANSVIIVESEEPGKPELILISNSLDPVSIIGSLPEAP